MRFNDILKMAFRDLGRRKGRTFLTSIAIAIGSMLIVTMVGLGTTAEKFIMDKMSQQVEAKFIHVLPAKYTDNKDESGITIEQTSEEERKEDIEKTFKKLDNNVEKKMSSIKGVEKTEKVISAEDVKIKINGVESKKQEFISLNPFNDSLFDKSKVDSVRKSKKDDKIEPVIAGRLLSDADKNGVLINEKLLKTMGITDYKSIIDKDITIIKKETEDRNIALKPLEMNVKVVGIISSNFENEYGNQIITPIEIINRVKSYYTLKKDYFEEKGYDYIVLHAKEASDVKKIGEEIKKLGYSYMSQDQAAEMIKSTLVTVQQVLSILGLIVLFVAAIGTMNTMTMAIHERTKSIGIMKSIGATRSNIHNIFLVQSATIGFIGGVIGILFSLLNSKIIEFALKAYLNRQGVKEAISFSLPMWLVLGTLVFAVLISSLSGIYPARKASKLDVIEALNS